MNFKLRTIKGQSRKRHKEWRDETKTYRIVWTNEVRGVRVPAHYFALIQTILPDERRMWDFVGRRGSYKTGKKAMKACDEHQRMWTRALEATGVRKFRDSFPRLPFGIPVWVKPKINRTFYAILMDTTAGKRDYEDDECDPSDLTKICETSPSVTRTATAPIGPVSLVEAGAHDTSTPSIKTGASECLSPNAKTAKAAEKAPKRPSRKPTEKQSKSGGSKRKSTTCSSKPAKRHSRSSPRRK